MDWQATHRERKELTNDIIAGEVWYLQTFPPSELTTQVVDYKLFANLSNRNWDFSYNKIPHELWELEQMNAYKTLFKHYTGSVARLLDYFCRHRYVLWVQALLEFYPKSNLVLSQDYILYVAKRFPNKFVHCASFLSRASGMSIKPSESKEREFDKHEQKQFLGLLLKIVVSNRSCVCWQHLLSYLDTEEMLYALCKYHSQQLKYRRDKDRYWDLSKLSSFSVMVELAFRCKPVFSARLLEVVPDLPQVITISCDWDQKRMVAQKGVFNYYWETRCSLYDLFASPVSMLEVLFPARKSVYYTGLTMSAFLLFYLAHGFPVELPKEIFEDYQEHLEEAFRSSQASLWQVRNLLADFVWKNYYQYLYQFHDLPMELRVHIGSLCW